MYLIDDDASEAVKLQRQIVEDAYEHRMDGDGAWEVYQLELEKLSEMDTYE